MRWLNLKSTCANSLVHVDGSTGRKLVNDMQPAHAFTRIHYAYEIYNILILSELMLFLTSLGNTRFACRFILNVKIRL